MMLNRHVDIGIVDAGLSGLSTSLHLGHPDDAVICEAEQCYGGSALGVSQRAHRGRQHAYLVHVERVHQKMLARSVDSASWTVDELARS